MPEYWVLEAFGIQEANSLAPAMLGVVGTVVGGILTASVGIVNARSSRKRDRELETRRHDREKLARSRDERKQIYAEWLSAFGHFLAAASGGQSAELEQSVMGMSRVGDGIQLVAPPRVIHAVRLELDAVRTLEGRITDRDALLAEVVRLHDSTIERMRQDLQE